MKDRQLVQSLVADTTALALPEGRRVGTSGHDLVRKYLLARMKEIELDPWKGDTFELNYSCPLPETYTDHTFSNLIGVIRGTNSELNPILIGAHYDSVIDGPCADDNATSVALTLAIASHFQSRPLSRDLIIAFFDAEEPPHFLSPRMGSTRFFEDHCEGIDFAAAIISDLIGHDFELSDFGIDAGPLKTLLPSVAKTVFLLGAESHPAFPDIVEEAASKAKKLRIFPTLNSYVGNLSDHHAFEKAGQPFLFLSCGQGKYYHQHEDDLDWINFEKLARIVDFVADLIEKIDRAPSELREPTHCTLDFEIRMIKKVIGPAFPYLTKMFGFRVPENRSEMDRLIYRLI